MYKQLNLLLIVFLFLSCNRSEKRTSTSVFEPERIEAHGYIVPTANISKPISKVAGKPLEVKAGKPQEAITGGNIKLAGVPTIVLAGVPEIRIPGQNGYTLPKEVISTSQTFLSGIPEVVIAKDAYSKDVNPYSFTSLGTIQGLKHNQIRCLIQDRNGNLWFSNDDGVTRYDGKYLTHFTVENGLSNNIVLSMMEDRDGRFWFGTFGGGVTSYDGKYFTHYTVNEGLSNNIVNSILQDKIGNYWFATSGGGVSKFDGKVFTHYTSKEGLESNQIRAIFQDKEGMIWFGTFGNGVTKFDGKGFKNYNTNSGYAGVQTVSIFQDKEDNLWFGTYNSGAIKYDGKYFYQYTVNQGLSDNNILCMIQDGDGSMWFGTTNGGISKFDGKNFIHFTEKEGLTNNYVRCCLIDKRGTQWFGTRDGGLLKYMGNQFTHYTDNDGLGNSKVMYVMQDKSDNYWLGAFSGGITKFDGKKFSRYSLKEGLLNERVYSILEDDNRNIWFGTDGRGICRFDGKAFFHYTYNEGLCHDGVRSILLDRNKNLWICTYGGGVSKFDGKNFVNYNEKSGLSSDNVLCMLEDKNGTLWFGTAGSGVTKFDGKIFTHFAVNEGLGNNTVACILEDKDGNLWFGTSGSGVVMYDGKFFTRFSEKEGLTNNYINSLYQDRIGNIWMGTRLGPNILEPGKLQLKLKNPELPLFKNYSYQEGFLGIGCNIDAIYEDGEGTIWIGATNRLTAIHLEGEVPDTIAPNIQLLKVELFNENIPWIDLENKTDTSFYLNNGVKVGNFRFTSVSKWYYLPENLSLAHNNNFLSFDFIGISQKQTQKIKYQYQLKGLDNNWNTPTDQTKVSYGNLEPGDYQFRVKAMNSRGVWSNEYHYSFTIRPPWWETWWFYALSVLGSISVILTFIKWRELRLEQQKLLLEKIVKEQTYELKEKNEELQLKNEELLIINSEKDKFFSIISHDVRGPLSSFIGLTEIMGERLQSFTMNEIQNMTNSMNNSAANLYELLGNLLEWARMQRGLIAFNPELLPLKDLLNESTEVSRQAAKNKSITIEEDIPDGLMVAADKNMLGSVMRNLVSNAVKFTPKNGKVIIKASDNGNDTVMISVKDTGIGMKKEMISNLFRIDININRIGTEGEPSTGLGLLLCKDFIEKHGGRIWAESEADRLHDDHGSTFYFTIQSGKN